MSAYDLYYRSNTATLNIANFNVMSHLVSRFAKPYAGDANNALSGETESEWRKRYALSVEMLSTLILDILCLEEVTDEYYQLLLQSSNMYIYYYPKPDNLAILINKDIVDEEPIQIALPSFQYSKIKGLSLHLVNGKIVNIINVHLIGNPSESKQRRRILSQLVSPGTIIIGDFNESVEGLLEDENFADFLSNNNQILTNMGEYMTSYSKFIVNPYGMAQVKPEAWDTVDNILLPVYIPIVNKTILPAGGLEGKEVPYIFTSGKTFLRNFSFPGWISDHSLNIYSVFL